MNSLLTSTFLLPPPLAATESRSAAAARGGEGGERKNRWGPKKAGPNGFAAIHGAAATNSNDCIMRPSVKRLFSYKNFVFTRIR